MRGWDSAFLVIDASHHVTTLGLSLRLPFAGMGFVRRGVVPGVRIDAAVVFVEPFRNGVELVCVGHPIEVRGDRPVRTTVANEIALFESREGGADRIGIFIDRRSDLRSRVRLVSVSVEMDEHLFRDARPIREVTGLELLDSNGHGFYSV